MDETARNLLRAWRSDPADPVAADTCAAAFHRARVELPWELIPALTRWRRPLEIIACFAALPPTEADGWPETDLLAAEARLGLRLPAALREWYRVVGRWTGAPQLLGWTVPLPELALTDGLLVVLRTLDARASVREADLGRDDPPAFLELDRRSESGRLGAPLSTILGGRLQFEVARDGPWVPQVQTGTWGHRDLHLTWLPLLGDNGPMELLRADALHGHEELLAIVATGWTHVRARTPEAWADVQRRAMGRPR
jgi:hypothetical protein